MCFGVASFVRRVSVALIPLGFCATILAIASCGGGGPTAPSPSQQAPSTPAVVPSVTKVTIVKTDPSAGATINANSSWVTGTVSVDLAQSDIDAAVAGGYTLAVETCMSQDGRTCVPVKFTSPILKDQTTNKMRPASTYEQNLRVSPNFAPDVHHTDYVVSYLVKQIPHALDVPGPPDVPIPETLVNSKMPFDWK